MNLTTENLSYSAVVVFMLLFDCILVNRLRRIPGFGRSQYWILTLLAATAVCALSDALCVYIGAGAGRTVTFLLNAIFDLSTECIAFFLFMYLELRYDSERILKSKIRFLLFIPLILMVFLIMASWWTGWIFSVDNQGNYTRGPLFIVFVSILANGYCVAAIVDFAIHLRKEKSPQKRKLLKQSLMYFVPLVIGTVMQFFITGLPTSNIGLTLTILLIFMDNQEMLLTTTYEELKEHQKLLQDALKQAETANRAKTTFLSSMSHDIRTPMNAIVGFTALAQTHIDDKEKVKEYLSKISTSGSHLLSLINDILDMSRIESGSVKLEEATVHILDILRDLKTMVLGLVNSKNQNLYIDTQDVLHEDVITDKLRLNQVLINIVGNAIKYTPEGGDIIIRLSEKRCYLKGYTTYEFTVRDTGVGMSKEFVSHIFDTFSREYTSSTNGIQGTGLGMAITKNIVNMMGGSINVESEEGKGTTVTVTLNVKLADAHSMSGLSNVLAQPDSNAVSEATVAEIKKYDYSGKHVLLVEDNELNREIATAILEETGMTIDCAVDGIEAVNVINEAPEDRYDLILMDIQMPKMDGYTATKEIRTLPNNRKANIPIVAMTANAFEEDKRKAFETGMNGHIVKPVSMEAIAGVLDGIF